MKPEPKTILCAIYCRVSEQDKKDISDTDSLQAQKDACKRFIESKGWQVYPEDYIDRSISGSTVKRPALDRLLNDARQGKFQMIVFRAIDRFTRSLLHFEEVFKKLEQYGVTLMSATQPFNSDDPIGKFYIQLLLSFADLERQQARERTRAKMAFQARQGLFHGGCPPLGYDFIKGKKGHLKINAKEASLVRQIFTKYISRQSTNLVAKHFNGQGSRTKKWITQDRNTRGGAKFTEGVILHLLKNQTYIGKTREGEELHKGNWKAIIDAKTFERVQRILKKNTVTRSSISENKYQHLLGGLVLCSHCKSTMTNHYTLKKGIPFLYYRCTRFDHSDKSACTIKAVPARALESVVIDRIKFLSTHKDFIDASVKYALKLSKSRVPVLEKERDEVLGRMKRINNQAESLLQNFSGKTISFVQNKLSALDEEKTALENRARALSIDIEAERRQIINPDIVVENLKLFRQIFDKLPFEKQSELIHTLIKKILYKGDLSKVEITYWNLPKIKPPDEPTKGKSGGSSRPSHRFDERTNWLPLCDEIRNYFKGTMTI